VWFKSSASGSRSLEHAYSQETQNHTETCIFATKQNHTDTSWINHSNNIILISPQIFSGGIIPPVFNPNTSIMNTNIYIYIYTICEISCKMRMGKKYPSGYAGTRVGSVVHGRRVGGACGLCWVFPGCVWLWRLLSYWTVARCCCWVLVWWRTGFLGVLALWQGVVLERGRESSCFGQWFVGDAVVMVCWSAGPMRMITIGLVFGPFNLVSRPSPLLNKLWLLTHLKLLYYI
jgi:hypothetical protein